MIIICAGYISAYICGKNTYQMIQRIQTLFLLFGAICSGLLFYFPFATSESVQSSAILSDGVYNFQDNIAIPILFGAAILLSLGALVSFKNRKNQTLLTRFALIANFIGMILVTVFFFNDGANMASVEPQDEVGAYMPMAAMLLLAFALYFIKKDEKLVRSMDRLR